MEKFATLFRRGNRYKSRKTLSFHTNKPFQLQLRYSEEENNWLPIGTDPVIETYVFDGLPTTDKYNYTGKPKVHVQFLLSTSGIIELVKAEAEITVIQYVSKPKTKENKEEESIKSEQSVSDEEEEEENKEEKEESERTENEEKNTYEEENNDDTEDREAPEYDSDEQKSEEPETETEAESEAEAESEVEDKETEEEENQIYSSEIEEVLEEVKKTIKIPLQVQSSQKNQLPLDSLKRSQKILQYYDEKDRIRYETENARNELESFIYDTQDKLYDETFISMSTEEERQTLSDALSSASVWLEDNTAASLGDLLSKKAEVTSVGESIFFRLKESTARNEAFGFCAQTINFTKTSVENITLRLEVTEEELTDLLNLCDDTLNWMVQKYTEQEEQPLYKDPLVTSEQINQKCKGVTKLATKLLKRPKKKPPKVEKVETNEKTKTTTDREQQKHQEQNQDEKETSTHDEEQTNFDKKDL
eukprot:TRINITY_DN3058_c0_g1_i1.p1 TRINITY_DN3058_c0_g1~~TRINITY_DN3058_c0_g1_i1.p1  ORF type:complete len:476 (+),score=164.76 TRINITY_DN3058_c0_g1_i1:95-1522(+)